MNKKAVFTGKKAFHHQSLNMTKYNVQFAQQKQDNLISIFYQYCLISSWRDCIGEHNVTPTCIIVDCVGSIRRPDNTTDTHEEDDIDDEEGEDNMIYSEISWK